MAHQFRSFGYHKRFDDKSDVPLRILFNNLICSLNSLHSLFLLSLARRRKSAFPRKHRRIGFLPCPLSPLASVPPFSEMKDFFMETKKFCRDPLNAYLIKDCLIILSVIFIKSSFYILTMLAFTISIWALMTSLIGCVAIINYAPRAERASLYTHEQNASNMVVNQNIPMTAQLANELSGIVGAQIKNNSVSSSVKGVEVQKPKIK